MSGFRTSASCPLTLSLLLGITACSGQDVMDEPKALALEEPLVATSDEQLSLWLDWVVVRDGPGSWVRNANWDQYLLRAGNLSAERIRIARVVLYDSLGKPVQPSAAPKTLNRASREASRRYREAGIEITAGAGSQALMLAGATVAAGGAELGIAVLAGAASPAAAGVAIGAMALAPVLLVGGAVESYQEERVAREMITRHTPLPYDIEPATQQNITWFFPLSPSPQRLDVTYVDPTGERTLSLNVGDMLKGLHLGDMHGPIDGRESAR